MLARCKNTHPLLPFSTFQPFLSMHQFGHLCSQPFVSQPFPWVFSLLLHEPLHLC